MQSLAHDWFDQPVSPALEYAFVLEEEALVFYAARQAPSMVHPQGQLGVFQEELWKYDAAEFFLSTPDGSRYMEFNLAPNGAWWSCIFSGPRVVDACNPALEGVECHAHRDGQAWSCSARIPLDYLKKLGLDPKKSRLALCSILNSPQQIFLTTAEPREGQPDFHTPLHWGLTTCQL